MKKLTVPQKKTVPRESVHVWAHVWNWIQLYCRWRGCPIHAADHVILWPGVCDASGKRL